MSQADLDVNRSVRTILVKHWIDLGRLSVRSSDGKLWIRGSLARIAGTSDELTPAIVDAMFEDIKRIRSIKQFYFMLENWTNDMGAWHEIGKARSTEQQSISRPAGAFEIKSEPEGQ